MELIGEARSRLSIAYSRRPGNVEDRGLLLRVSLTATVISLVIGISSGTAIGLDQISRETVYYYAGKHRHGLAPGSSRSGSDDFSLAQRSAG